MQLDLITNLLEQLCLFFCFCVARLSTMHYSSNTIYFCWFLLGAAIYTRLQFVMFGAYVQPNSVYLTPDVLFNWLVSLSLSLSLSPF